jgi:5-hydroxyisourate hydrolase
MSAAAKSPITTHVLDVSLGRPAANIDVRLAKLEGDHFGEIGRGATDADGRVTTLLAPGSLVRGTYRISFDVGAYFAASQRRAFYPHVDIVFVVTEPEQHHHVPLLLSPFGYSTYRGS